MPPHAYQELCSLLGAHRPPDAAYKATPCSAPRFEDLKKEYAKANRGQGKKFDITLVPPEQHPVFNVQPDKVRGTNPEPGCMYRTLLLPKLQLP